MKKSTFFECDKMVQPKISIVVMALGFFVSNNLFSQANQKKTIEEQTLVWYIYIGGKPHMDRVRCEQKVATSWGINIEYFYGDCGNTYDYKAKEFEEKNKTVFEYLKKKHGVNWKEKFDKEVEKELETSK